MSWHPRCNCFVHQFAHEKRLERTTPRRGDAFARGTPARRCRRRTRAGVPASTADRQGGRHGSRTPRCRLAPLRYSSPPAPLPRPAGSSRTSSPCRFAARQRASWYSIPSAEHRSGYDSWTARTLLGIRGNGGFRIARATTPQAGASSLTTRSRARVVQAAIDRRTRAMSACASSSRIALVSCSYGCVGRPGSIRVTRRRSTTSGRPPRAVTQIRCAHPVWSATLMTPGGGFIQCPARSH